AGIELIGCGVSGGEDGARSGPSLMAGGEAGAYEKIRPAFEAIAAKTEMGPCAALLGPDGAGHFVKMVHNGIEYGDMQLIAEVYDLLRRAIGLDAGEASEAFARWNEGPLESFLIDLTSKLLTVRDSETGRPLVDLVDDRAGQKGTGRWAVEAASELGVPAPTIAAAVDARILSSRKEERIAAAGLYPQSTWDLRLDDREETLRRIGSALYAAKICCYAQGMNVIRAASIERGWNVPLRETARIWKGGCIIRARFLDVMLRAYAQNPDLENLLLDPEIRERMEGAHGDLRETVRSAVSLEIPVPALSASLAYFDAYRSPRLPQNLTQAQRDAFGAHGYERADRPGEAPLHTDWLGIEQTGERGASETR
ncbi:MAG: NADP-dependent phosphogluconate dehydrogenase, partial [Candidatus Eisenbacteria bacterium]|nr:NADP-dependent phosphogluconate dehydrogenase [Candidatus Eisenbacteria bacterium]